MSFNFADFHKLTSDQERFEYMLNKYTQIVNKLEHVEALIKALNKKIDGTSEMGSILMEDIFHIKKVLSNHSEVLKAFNETIQKHNKIIEEITKPLKDGSVEVVDNKDVGSK